MTQHRLCAEFRLRNGYGLLAIVDAEDEAVKKGLENDAFSFRICEADVATPEDNVPWILNPTTEYSEQRYLGVKQLYSPGEMAAEMGNSAAKLQASDKPWDKGTGDALAAVSEILTKHRDGFNAVSFIRDPSPYAREWEFVPLKSGEKAFDDTGKQIWPAPAPKP